MNFKDIYYSEDSREHRKEFRLGIHACYFSILDLCTKNDISLNSVEFDIKVNGEEFIKLGLNGKIVP